MTALRRLKQIADVVVSNVDKKSVDDERPVRLCNYTDVYYKERITPDMAFMEATATDDQVARFALRAGDVIITKDSETPDDIAVPTYVVADMPDTLCGYHLALLRPRHGVDGRYLFWTLTSHFAREQFAAFATGVTRFGLRYEVFGEVRLPLPSLDAQQAISDYLDAETGRIDLTIHNKTRLIDLLSERRTRLFHAALEARGFRWSGSLSHPFAPDGLPAGWHVARLSVVLRELTNGYVGPTRDLLVDEGVRYIQSLHIKEEAIDFSRGSYFVPLEWHEERPRIHLRAGDVLIVQTGDIGQVAVVPDGFGPASCHALQIARVRSEWVRGDYLGAYLQSPFGRHSLLSRATGALHPHLEGGIRDIPIVLPPLDLQEAITRELGYQNAHLSGIRSMLAQQIDLLREHRHALITAAVTGELDIAGVPA
jgi:type I restriction enzyme S subunit